MTRFNYIIPGILDELEDARTWDYQAQAWLRDHGCGAAAGFNYSAGVVGANLAQAKYSGGIAVDLIGAMTVGGFEPIDVAAHSKGCVFALEALRRNPELKIRRLHLIAAAADCDCDKNGINEIVARDVKGVEEIVLYVSPWDEVLGVGGLVPGYGMLGKLGPTNLTVATSEIITYAPAPEGCRHCDWVTKYFEATMYSIGDELEAKP